METTQKLIWMPKGRDVGAMALKCEVPYDGEMPKRLWTLYFHDEESNPPILPFKPAHLTNAFLEDKMHDWDIREGKLHYYSRACEGGVWLLFEF
jgi:hypothetical protein